MSDVLSRVGIYDSLCFFVVVYKIHKGFAKKKNSQTTVSDDMMSCIQKY